MIIRLGRQYRFFAAHRLHTSTLTDEQNANLFGKCSHPGGHGHTYKVDVVVSGTPDPETNMIMDLDVLDREVHLVLDQLAYKQIERDVPEFKGLVSTTENVVAFIYDKLYEKLDPLMKNTDLNLCRVEVAETRNNRFEAESSERDILH